jgi:hypothetical protein
MSVARPIGYACLVVVVLLILLGFLTKHRWFASLGTFAFFLPTFGDFAPAMFFLGGLGILRALWIPLVPGGWNKAFFRLGDVVFLPIWALIEGARQLIGTRGLRVLDVGLWLPYSLMLAGFLVFFLGTFTWLHSKLKKEAVVGAGIYKYMRHPQYLGFILWSYGILLLTPIEYPGIWGSVAYYPSFAWVVSTLTIICVALAEECSMMRLAGSDFREYREHTAFMIPLPSVIAKIVTAPHRILLRKALPENKKEILCVFIIYSAIIITLSYITYVSNVLQNWYFIGL